MCMKLVKKMCCMIVFSVMVGSVIYYLREKDQDGKEKGRALAEEFERKKDRLKNAADEICEDMSDIRDSAKSVFENGEEV